MQRFGSALSTWLGVAGCALLSSPIHAADHAMRVVDVPITTFSIVAYDADTGEYGVGVQSKYFAVGDVVPFARADVGALAT